MEFDIARWCGEKKDFLNLSGTINLAYNGSVFVKEGIGYMLSFDGLTDTGAESELCFRPLNPKLETKMFVIWRKFQVFTPIAEILLDELKALLSRRRKSAFSSSFDSDINMKENY